MDTTQNTRKFDQPSCQRGSDATLVIVCGNYCDSRELGARQTWEMGRAVQGAAGSASPVVPLSPLLDAGPDIQINSNVVSHRHGNFRCQNSIWYYADNVKVKNSTYYNGRRLQPGEEVQLFHKDILRIDSMSTPNPQGVWILFSAASILGTWENRDISSLPEGQKLWIGRDSSCEIQEDLDYVSAKHAFLQRQNGQFLLADHHSTNKTYLNAQEVIKPVPLKEKDWFSICDCHFILVDNHLVYNKRRKSDQPAVRGQVLLSANIQSKTVPDRKAPGGKKELLRDIRLDIKEGSLVALLGVSGAGKSTLMSCLNGFDFTDVTGNVIYNGEDLYKNFNRQKREIGSVPQANTLRSTQTVETELRYDAILRMPGDTKRAKINEKVNDVIHTLGLQEKRKTRLHKLSGGEEKRVSIGVELVADRTFLCLDEPDAGLDPLTKRQLFQMLKRLTRGGGNNSGQENSARKTILVIIHDVSDIDLFDQVIMLLKEDCSPPGTSERDRLYRGRLAFSGPPAEALRYFQEKNLTDTKSQLTAVKDMTDAYALVTKNPMHYIWHSAAQPNGVQAAQPASGQRREKSKPKKSLSWFRELMMSVQQFAALLFAPWLDSWKAFITSLAGCLAFPLIATLLTVFFAGKNMFADYEGTRTACLILVCCAIWSGMFNSMGIIARERNVVKLEYMAGRRLGCYILSNAVVQMFLCLIQSVFLMLAIPLINLRFDHSMPDEGIIFESTLLEYYVTLVLVMWAADAMGMLLSCFVKKVENANKWAPIIVLGELVFSGALFSLEGIGEKFSLAALSRWGMAALGSISDMNIRPLRIQLSYPSIPDRAIEEIFFHEGEHLLFVWGVIFVLFFILVLALSALVLRKVAKDTR